jgi:phospholipid/cholesterol/gamma-HCH transport system substrate-binding protein
LEAKTNYFFVGMTVLILGAGLLVASLWLSTGFQKIKYDTFTVYIKEPISGLNNESPVKFNGVKVGYISKIELNPANPQQVRLKIEVEQGTPVNTNTEATLVAQGITGTTYLGLSTTSSARAPLKKLPGEPFPVIPYKASFFYLLEKNVSDVSTSIKRVFDEENTEHLKKSFANMEKITSIIAKNNENLNQSLKELPVLIRELKRTAQEFNSMSHDISYAGKQVSSTMTAGRNSIDKFSHQVIPPAVELLRKLDLMAANLEKTSMAIRQNPAVIIRGSTPPKPGPGERH